MADSLSDFETEVTLALMGLSARQTQLTPIKTPQKWSIQQIIEHLLLSYQVTEKVLAERLQRKRPTKAKPSLRQRLAQWAIISRGKFPSGRDAPDSVQPTQLLSLQSGLELVQRMQAELGQMEAQLRQGEQLFGNSRAASHVVLGPLSMQQWRKFHAVHGRHHLKQIAMILDGHGQQQRKN